MFDNSFYTNATKKFKQIVIEAQVLTFANKIQLIKFKGEIKKEDAVQATSMLVDDTLDCMRLMYDIAINASKNPKKIEQIKIAKSKLFNPLLMEGGPSHSDVIPSKDIVRSEFVTNHYTKDNLYNKFWEKQQDHFLDAKLYSNIQNLTNKNNEAK